MPMTTLKTRHKYIFSVLFLFLIMSNLNAAHGASTLNISEGDEWQYFTGAVPPDKNWIHVDFDDSAWKKGPSGFGYGKGKHNTLLSDMQGKYKSVYVRKKFTVDSFRKITRLSLSLICDGPFVAYLDGIEAIRSKRRQVGDQLSLLGFAHELDHHLNVLAIKCSNDDINSDDFSFIPAFQFHEE